MAVLTVQRPTNEVLMPRLGARTHLEYTWAHAVKVHTVPPCEVRRGAPAPSPAVRAEGPHLPAPSPWVEPRGPHRHRECRGRSAPAVEVRALSVVWVTGSFMVVLRKRNTKGKFTPSPAGKCPECGSKVCVALTRRGAARRRAS